MRSHAWLAVVGLALVFGCEGDKIDNPFPGPNPPTTSSPALALRIGGTGTDAIAATVIDPTGNVYVAGTFTESVDFDPGPATNALTSLGETDVFLAKYSPTGSLAWVSRIGGTSAETVATLTRDAAGFLYLGGTFQGATDFDPTSAFEVQNSAGATDGYVVKLSSDGLLVWSRRFGGTSDDLVTSLAVDGGGNVYAGGSFLGTANTLPVTGPTLSAVADADGFILALNSVGSVRWALSVGGLEADAVLGVGLAVSGAVQTAGTFRSGADFDHNGFANLFSQGGTDVFLASYDPNGLLLSARDIGGVNDDLLAPGGLTVKPTGDVVLLGSFSGAADFDPGPGTTIRNSISDRDVFVARYAAGDLASVFSLGGQGVISGSRLVQTGDGGLALAGAFSGSLDFDPGSGSAAITSLATAGGTDAFVAKYGATGAFEWVSRFGEAPGTAATQDKATALAADPVLGIFVGGIFFGSPDLDPGDRMFVLTSLGESDGFLLKLTSIGGLAQAP